MNVYQHLDPFRMKMMSSFLHYMPTNMTYCNTTRVSHLAEDERLRAFQGHLKKLSKHGVFSMACLLDQCSCADFCNLGRYGSARLYVSVLPPVFVISMLTCSFYCSSCPPVQLLPSPQLLITGKISHQTGMAMTRAETSGSGYFAQGTESLLCKYQRRRKISSWFLFLLVYLNR